MRLCLGLLLAAAVAASEAAEYDTQYDYLDLDDILRNGRLYKKYLDCLLSRGKCTPDGKELKIHLAEAIKTDCAKCSARQKAGAEKVLLYLLAKKKDDFDAIEKVYDPEGLFRKKHGL